MNGHRSGVTSVVFSADGKRLASAGADKTVKIWGAGQDATDSKASESASAVVPRPATTIPTTPAPATGSPIAPIAPRLITSKSIGMQLTLIPVGTFTMGSPVGETDRKSNEGPPHSVQISQPFYMGVYEVTQAEFESVMGTNPSWFSKTGSGSSQVSGQNTSQFPVERVSWFDAIEFCNKLSVMDGLTPYYSLTNATRDNSSIKSATVSVASRAASAQWHLL